MTPFRLAASAAVLLALSACAAPYDYKERIMTDGQYWQRKDASSALYTQGPKAQQILNRDIARCVVELKELEQLGQVKSAFPAEAKDTSKTGDDARDALMDWETPERDGMLLIEHSDYQDFETCMIAKGWDRIMYVPYETAEKSRDAYIQNHIDLKHRTTWEDRNKPTETKGPYDGLNQ